MDRRKLEQTTASLVILLLFVMTVGLIMLMADQFFGWDIFPPDLEKIIGFMMAAFGVVIFSSVLVNIMLNLSIIAINSDKITLEKFAEPKSSHDSNRH